MTQQVPIKTIAWPGNGPGLRKWTVPTMAKFIRRRVHDPRMRALAGRVLRDAGFPKGIAAKCEALRLYAKSVTDYASDPVMSEYVQDPEYSLCLPGAAMCAPLIDCDDGVPTVDSLIGAAGMEPYILLLEYGGGAQIHVMGAVKDEKGAILEVDVTTDKPVGYKSWSKTRSVIDPFDPKMLEDGEFKGGAFIGAGRASAIVPVMDPALRLLGAGAVTPGDVLSYRAMWNQYVLQTACALSVQSWAATWAATNGMEPPGIDVTQPACDCAGPASSTVPNGQDWAAGVTSGILDLSIFAQQPPSAALLTTYAQASFDQAQALLDGWNIESGLTDLQIVQQAASILGSMQDTVLQCGQQFRPSLSKASPGLAAAIVQGPDTRLQAKVIAQLEGAGIVARGALQVVELGAQGAAIGFKTAAQTIGDAGKVALNPWLWGAIAVITASAATVAVAYVYKTSGAPALLAHETKKKRRKMKRAA